MPVAMKRLPVPLAALSIAALTVAAPARAAERRYVVTQFDRVRVDGPFDVRVATRGAPAARAVGAPDATDGLDIRVEGTTLIVRAGARGWTALPHADPRAAPVLYLRTQTLRGATVIGGGRLDIDGPVRGQRVDLQLTGSGTMTVPALDVDQFTATLLGGGTMTLGGRAARVRLLTSGAGTIEATALQADELVLRLDGAGTTRATARYVAQVTTTGLGAATVYGKAACTVNAVAGGPIRCGVPAAP